MPRDVIIFTTEEGGRICTRWGDRREFEYIKRAGAIYDQSMDSPDPFIPVAYVALCRMVDDHDVVLGGRRETR